MRGAIPFRFNRSGLMLAIVSTAFSSHAQALAGRAEFTIGGVTVARGGVERPLTRGTELDNGDTVRTNDGRAQIRFTDGAYVSLQPNTEYSIREYRFDNTGNERGFFGLLKGAMRTVTGAIGRLNRDRYQIATPTATVGIRGTGGVIQVQDDGSTLVTGTSGIWSLTNPAGSVDVPAGTSAVAPSDPNQPPQETTQQPTSGPAPVPEEEPIFVAGEERDEAGLPVIPLVPLKTGPGYTAAVASSFSTGPGTFDATIDGGGFNANFRVSDAVFDGQGRLTSISDSSQVLSATLTTGQHGPESATDGVLAWGRWTNGQVEFVTGQGPAPETYTANQGLHYVVGMPTASMPTSGTATYSLLGATSPTYSDGRSAPGTFTGNLGVTFGSLASITGSFAVAMPDGKSWQWSGSTSTATALFSMVSTCGCSCQADVTGFFAGASAERAGIGYLVHDTGSGTIDVVGTAAFKQD
jgi:hypothetical protein